MTVETEISLAQNQAASAGWNPEYFGIVLHYLEEKVHQIRSSGRPLSDPELKDCIKAIKTVKKDRR